MQMEAMKVENINPINNEGEMSNTLWFYKQLIKIANKYFGEQNWSHSVTYQAVDYMGEETVGCITFVKVQLNNGVFHEEESYCLTEGSNKGLAIFKATNVSKVNALKNCLMCFGDEICLEICVEESKANIKSIEINASNNDVTLKKSKLLGNKLMIDNQHKPIAESTPKPANSIIASSDFHNPLDKIDEDNPILDISHIVKKEPIIPVEEVSKLTLNKKPTIKTETLYKQKQIKVENKKQEQYRKQKEKLAEYRKMFYQECRSTK